ncbi:hypothetical protein AB0G79_22085 [Streptomyces sp. NPDC020807]|uniref:hypothetical protein n=1 Tax=Streptomyces sp. NPDC020807 TaxID=3155119 RepID=UPI0033CB7E9D
MISEPELGEGDPFYSTEVLDRTPPPGEPRPPRARRPWLWALGGALAASVVWGGGLYAYEQRQGEAEVDLGGYKAVGNLCEKAELRQLVGILGERSSDSGDSASRSPQGEPVEGDPEGRTGESSMDVANCSVTFGPPETGYSGTLSYVRHLVTDPGPEFDDNTRRYFAVQPFEGVGEKAYADVSADNGGATMVVLDGQVEISLNIYAMSTWDEDKGESVQKTKPIDLSGIDVPMAQDMLALMKALKS